jgi:hypothetical protein
MENAMDILTEKLVSTGMRKQKLTSFYPGFCRKKHFSMLSTSAIIWENCGVIKQAVQNCCRDEKILE